MDETSDNQPVNGVGGTEGPNQPLPPPPTESASLLPPPPAAKPAGPSAIERFKQLSQNQKGASFIGIGVLLVVVGIAAAAALGPKSSTSLSSGSNSYYSTTTTTTYRSSGGGFSSSTTTTARGSSGTTAPAKPTGNGALVLNQSVSGTCYTAGKYLVVLGNNQATTYNGETGSSSASLSQSAFGSSSNRYGEDAKSVAGVDAEGKPVIVISSVNRQAGTGINLDTVAYYLTAYDASSGSQRWQADSTFGAAKLPPGSSDTQPRFIPFGLTGPVVVGLLEQRVGSDNKTDVIGVNLADGQEAWRYTLTAYQKPDANDVGSDTVFVEGGRDGNIIMLDASSGAPTGVAVDASDFSSWSMFQLDHDNFVGVAGNQLIGVRRDGSVAWRYPRISGDLIIDYTSGVVIFQDGSSNSAGLLAYDGRAGNQLWGIDRGRMSEVNLSLKQANNGYAVGSARGKTIVFDDRTGAQVIADYSSDIYSYGRWIDNKIYVSCGGNSRATSFIADKAPVGITNASFSSDPQLVFPPSGSSGSSGTTVVTIVAPGRSQAPAQYRVVSPGCGDTCKVYRRGEPNHNSPDHGYHIDGDTVTVVCQITGEMINDSDNGNSNVWAKLDSGYYVSDLFLNTPKPGPAPNLPTCT